LHESEKAMREEQVKHKKLVGVVVNSGKMDKTVTVRINGQKWNARIRKVSGVHQGGDARMKLTVRPDVS
jgi:small subunit ribosomal protein S17